MKEIIIYSRTGCHLCEVARAEIERIAREGEVEIFLKEILIDGNQELEREFGLMVPVIQIDGAMHGFGRVEETRLKKALAD